MIQLACLIVGIFAMNACSAYKGVRNMEKNTAEMNDTTRKMNATTRDMNDTTREMKSVTESMQAKTSDMADDTDAMRKSTEELLRKTADLNRTTADMSSTTRAMRDDIRDMNRATETLTHLSSALDRQTNHLYHDNRQGQSLELRLKTLVEMKNTKKQFGKIKYANFYYKSFEFQLWKNVGTDDDTQLDYMRFQAAQEMIQTIDELVPEGQRTLSPLSEKSSMQDLYALAAALHVINNGDTPAELAESAEEGLSSDLLPETEDHEPQGMLALIYGALRQKKMVENGSIDPSELKPYESAILKFEEVAVFILRVRVQFLTAIVVKQLSTPDGEHLGMFRRLGMILTHWKPKTDSRNVVQLRYYGWILGEAMATRDFLRRQGLDSPLDSKLKRVVHQMRWTYGQGVEQTARNTAIQTLEDRFKTLAE